MSNSKGDRWERNYVNALSASDPETDKGAYNRVGIDDFAFVELFTALRLPASGGGRDADLPDLHVWLRTGDEVYQFAVEVKSGAERVSFDNDEISALERYAQATVSTALVFVHIDKDSRHDDLGGDYVVPIDDLHSTNKGYSFTKMRDGGIDVDQCTGIPFAEWVKRPTSSI